MLGLSTDLGPCAWGLGWYGQPEGTSPCCCLAHSACSPEEVTPELVRRLRSTGCDGKAAFSGKLGWAGQGLGGTAYRLLCIRPRFRALPARPRQYLHFQPSPCYRPAPVEHSFHPVFCKPCPLVCRRAAAVHRCRPSAGSRQPELLPRPASRQRCRQRGLCTPAECVCLPCAWWVEEG